MRRTPAAWFAIFALAICSVPPVAAQEARGAAPPAQGRGGGRGAQAPAVVSPDVMADRRVAFRIYAPQADAVRIGAGDIQGLGQATQLTKGENGVWELTIGPIDPGAYRYNFNVDGVTTIDPRNPATSESNNNVWSLFVVPGAGFMDTKRVPHGAVAAVTYYSTALGTFRRMQVYTPPGYESGSSRYPVFYLLHGAGDSDDAWPTVGRAGFILDNLIADGKAKPMIVVMPAGHTRRTTGGAAIAGRTANEEFVSDFVTDVLPYVEKNYRVRNDRASRAIAGLSMGGNHTLLIGIPHLDKFAYIGVYSSGLFGGGPGGRGRGGEAAAAPAPVVPPAPSFEQANAAVLGNANLKKGLKLLWFSTGKDDGLIDRTVATVEMLKKHGFHPIYKESPGGHTWINWRNYLHEFAPQLFQ
jgi:enterochelin esterase-like enzyme